jgi:transposase-like protein
MIERIYLDFPNDDCYKEYLLQLRWDNKIVCPFCNSLKNTKIPSSFRYHCNTCNTNFSLTANTILHDTKVDLRKWLITLYLYLNDQKLSYRNLSKLINVNKNTAYRMIKELHYLFTKKRLQIFKIAGYNRDSIEVLSLMLLINIGRKI